MCRSAPPPTTPAQVGGECYRIRVAAGSGDPFYPGVQALARALLAPDGEAVVDFGPGCHDDYFFAAQEPPSLAFVAGHLAS